MLRGDSPNQLTSLQSLKIEECDELSCCVLKAPEITNLSISEKYLVGSVVEAITNTQLSCLTSLSISNCSSQISFSMSAIFPSLQQMRIEGCRELEIQMDGQHHSLQELYICSSCDSLASYSLLDSFPNLVHLQINNCGNMEFIIDLFDTGHPHRSLRFLEISNIEKLVSSAAFMHTKIWEFKIFSWNECHAGTWIYAGSEGAACRGCCRGATEDGDETTDGGKSTTQQRYIQMRDLEIEKGAAIGECGKGFETSSTATTRRRQKQLTATAVEVWLRRQRKDDRQRAQEIRRSWSRVASRTVGDASARSRKQTRLEREPTKASSEDVASNGQGSATAAPPNCNVCIHSNQNASINRLYSCSEQDPPAAESNQYSVGLGAFFIRIWIP
ncbi:hypothetical protein Ahy_A10g051241 [Arachis hypogaea]|uniref:Uncharacterized protein n=1 Tax=Arachis hypogaea TaxID=3818 RepID=A0A445BC33_ARAHY|nr:hypothetical protein Ahy_A10g051241 [Arachis hypogaea]